MTTDYVPPSDQDAPPAEYENITPIQTRRNHNGNHTTTSSTGRVPPHDLDAEAALLGACMIKGQAIDAAIEAGVQPDDFYRPAHADVWRIIIDLRQQHPNDTVPADYVTVHSHLNTTTLTVADLAGLGEHAVTSNVARYAAAVTGTAHMRRVISWVADVAEAAYGAHPAAVDAALLKTPPVRVGDTPEPLEADMQAILNGETDPVIPSLIARDDHETCLLYTPGIHWLSGEPGKGKSLLSLSWVARELERGNHVLYVDFEGTAERVAAQLAQMGCADLTRLSYVRRFEAWNPATLTQLRHLIAQHPYTLAVFDAVAGAMEAEGLDPESNRDAEKWVASIPMQCFAAGMAVVCVDHVVKNAEARGRWMIGAQRKMARADAAFALEMHEEAGVGRTGHGRLLVTKDRYGALAQFQAGKTVALVTIASEEADHGHTLKIRMTPPPDQSGVNGTGGFTPTWYMEQVSQILERAYEPVTVTELRKRIGKTAKYVDEAVDVLLRTGHIAVVEQKGKAKPYRSVRPYRQPTPDELAAPLDDNDEPW